MAPPFQCTAGNLFNVHVRSTWALRIHNLLRSNAVTLLALQVGPSKIILFTVLGFLDHGNRYFDLQPRPCKWEQFITYFTNPSCQSNRIKSESLEKVI